MQEPPIASEDALKQFYLSILYLQYILTVLLYINCTEVVALNKTNTEDSDSHAVFNNIAVVKTVRM